MQLVDEIGGTRRPIPPQRELARPRAHLEAPELTTALFVDGEPPYVGGDCGFVPEPEQQSVLGALDRVECLSQSFEQRGRSGISSSPIVHAIGADAS